MSTSASDSVVARPIVLVSEELSPAGISLLSDDFEVRTCDGADRSALLPALAEADALIVRSATTVDAEALAAAPRLKVVARAGVGLDNVDVPAATARGVMVVNAPQSNIVSAAEHAVALLLSVARRVPQAHASLTAGQWKRSQFTGVELTGKTVGLLGLGRIGALVAQRLSAFGMTIQAYDPYVTAARAAQMGVTLASLEEVLSTSDVISVHLPKTPETLGLVGKEELATCKKGAILINAARGGLVDETALAEALHSGHLGGAGIDVYVKEPTTSSPLFDAPNVVVTPHLGASTEEAQEKAGLAVARSVRLALSGEFVPDAVNVQAGGVVSEDVRPGLPLAETLGQLFTGLAGGVASSITIEVRGEIAREDIGVLQLAALKGVFRAVVEEQVTYVNAPLLASERGIVVALERDEQSPDYRNVITVRGVLPGGAALSVSGTLMGTRQVERITAIDGYEVDLRPFPHLLFLRYEDRPGVVGAVGAILGEASVNIASAQVSRGETAGGEALMSLALDSPVPAAVVERIADTIGARVARSVDLASS
ncbi:MAG: D-3-phosphoglycerate dehydrogenase [Mycobacterium sp.]|jgi:D-3-phosphoglycerate dehydrogenase|nr:D-3-phosphoglycerate dehydrogenase [Mycobacterium sp.]